jgi:cellulose synthase/poly-beta-1,6-N-acetylglucosamine synthase-like glycosyltransferase
MSAPALSFVVPVKNEQETLRELFARIRGAVSDLGRSFEVIFVDDGSDDGSWGVIRSLVESQGGRAVALRFRRNLGKAAALAAGFRVARAEVIMTLDADLQDDPREIGRFLEKLDEGYDIVCGWKKVRHDPWHKVLPSRVFNAMLSRMSRTSLHDHNCGFKCYRRAVVKELAMYGEMHRMIPALGTMRGFRSAEIEVTHHPRRYGQSKYGFSRFLRGFMDMLTVSFLQNYRERPMHAMGGVALSNLAFGALAVALACSGKVGLAKVPFEIIGTSLLASVPAMLAVGFLSELVVSHVQSLRPPSLPLAEELFAPEVTIGTELTMVAACDEEPTAGKRDSGIEEGTGGGLQVA